VRAVAAHRVRICARAPLQRDGDDSGDDDDGDNDDGDDDGDKDDGRTSDYAHCWRCNSIAGVAADGKRYDDDDEDDGDEDNGDSDDDGDDGGGDDGVGGGVGSAWFFAKPGAHVHAGRECE
jgi:hypothetical protein